MSDRDVRKLAKIVADHSRQIKGLSGGPQAAYSSIEGGSMDSYDSDGKLRLRIGAQDDGTQGVKYVQGPPPPRPTAPVVSVDGPVVRVRWDGMLLGGHIPEDFSRIDVHFALASDDLEDEAAVRGNLATSAGNETVLAATQTGTYRVGLVAMSQSRARSEMSEVTEVEVELVNLKGAIDTAVDNASGGSNHYRPAPPEGTDHTENDLWFDTSVDPETGLTAYTPHRWDEAAQDWVSVGDQRTAAVQDAQDALEADIDSVRTSVDGKNRITQSVDAPPSQYDGAVGDRWERMSSMGSGGSLISNWRWNGDVWVSTIISDAVLGNVDAAKIGTGYLDADRIEAGSITADKMLIGGSENILPMSGVDSGAGIAPHAARGGRTAELLSNHQPGREYSNAILVRGQDVGTPGVFDHAFEFNSGGLSGPIYAGGAFPVKVGQSFRADTYIMRRGVEPHGHVAARLSFAWYDYAGSWIQTDSGAPGQGPYSPDHQIFVEAIAPAGAAYLRVFVGTDRPGDIVLWRTRLLEQKSAVFIEDGAIVAEKIAVGAITAESGVVGSLDAGVITVGEMNGARIEAGTIDTPQLAFGAATGDVLSVDALNFKTAVGLDIRGSSFRAGDAVEMTEDFGIRQFGPDGALNVSLPSDGSPAEFRGDLSARTLTATGRMSIQGPGAVASGGVLELESGVVPPVAGPQITNTWDRTTFPPLADSESPSGIAWAEGHWWRAVSVVGASSDNDTRARVEKLTSTGELVSSFPTAFGTGFNGMALHEGLLYTLGAVVGGAVGNRWVVAYNLDGTESHRWEYTAYGTGTYQPGIGVIGPNIAIAQCWAYGDLTWRIYRPSDGYQISRVDRDGKVASDIVGIHLGQFDLDAQKIIVGASRSTSSSVQLLAYSHSGTPEFESGYSWYAADYEAIRGFAWDGSRFWTLQPDGNLAAYQPLEAGRFVGDNDSDWWCAIAWAAGGGQETPTGPATNFRYLRRSRLRRQNGDVPEGVEAAAVFYAKTETEPARADLHWGGSNSSPDLVNHADYISASWQAARTPSAENTFTTDAPGEIRSALGNFRVDGTGAGEWGPLEFRADGTMTDSSRRIASGQISVDATANVTMFATVTFPVGRFTREPILLITPRTDALSQAPVVGSRNVTSESAQIAFRRGNSVETLINWFAIQQED